MDAKISKQVTIDSHAHIREFDLIKIKSNVKIQQCVYSVHLHLVRVISYKHQFKLVRIYLLGDQIILFR